METYQEFLLRIDSFERKKINYGDRYFKGNPSLLQKVGKNNGFKSFYGDTVVFALNDKTRKRIEQCVELLYGAASECFCERLASSTFHVTLHDLSSSPVLRDVAEELFENELKVIKKRERMKKHERIKMKSTAIFNMVDVSLVLGLHPADEAEYSKLMELYFMFDEVKRLEYPFTPHITLAYYNFNGFDLEAARRLENIVTQLNRNGMIEVELDIENLCYKKFKSMNEYIDIFSLGPA